MSKFIIVFEDKDTDIEMIEYKIKGLARELNVALEELRKHVIIARNWNEFVQIFGDNVVEVLKHTEKIYLDDNMGNTEKSGAEVNILLRQLGYEGYIFGTSDKPEKQLEYEPKITLTMNKKMLPGVIKDDLKALATEEMGNEVKELSRRKVDTGEYNLSIY